jgi:hypothetical protein
MGGKGEGDVPYDVFKDSLARYLGYANEVGESFRPVISTLAVRATYAVAGVYVVADAVDKGIKEHAVSSPSPFLLCPLCLAQLKQPSSHPPSQKRDKLGNTDRMLLSATIAGDTLLW